MFFVFVDLWFFLIKKKNFWRSLGSGFSFSFHCLSGFWIFYNGFFLVIWFICLLCGFVKLIYMLFGMWVCSELVVFSIFIFWDLFQFISWDSVMISRNWGHMFLFVVLVFLSCDLLVLHVCIYSELVSGIVGLWFLGQL